MPLYRPLNPSFRTISNVVLIAFAAALVGACAGTAVADGPAFGKAAAEAAIGPGRGDLEGVAE